MRPIVFARAGVYAYLGAIVVIPIFFVFHRAFADGLGVFIGALSSAEAVAAFRLTFAAATTIAVINAFLGTAAAYAITRYRIWGHRFLDGLLDLPFVIPTAVTGLVLAVMLGPLSPAGRFFESIGIPVLYHAPAVYIAFLVTTVPFVIRAVQPLILAIDPAEQDAAVSLGASPFQRFFAIDLPVIRPGILTGVALSFARSLGEFGVVVFVAGTQPFRTQVASTYVFAKIEHFDFSAASAASVVVLGVSMILLGSVRHVERISR